MFAEPEALRDFANSRRAPAGVSSSSYAGLIDANAWTSACRQIENEGETHRSSPGVVNTHWSAHATYGTPSSWARSLNAIRRHPEKRRYRSRTGRPRPPLERRGNCRDTLDKSILLLRSIPIVQARPIVVERERGRHTPPSLVRNPDVGAFHWQKFRRRTRHARGNLQALRTASA